MTDPVWPESLNSPGRSGYTLSLPFASHTDTVRGAGYSQPKLDNPVTVFNVQYLWNDDQLAQFHQYRISGTNYMTSWFTQRLKVGFDLVDQTVRFFEVKPYQKEGSRWRVKVFLECKNRHRIDDETAAFLLEFGSKETLAILSAVDRYDEAINYTVPYGLTELNSIFDHSQNYYQAINYTIPEIWSTE